MTDKKFNNESNGLEENLSQKFCEISLKDRGKDCLQEAVLSKGKPGRYKGSGPTCDKETKERLKEVLMQRRPMDYTVDTKTLDTPLHRFLEAPENAKKSSYELVCQLNRILVELENLGYLSVYVNMPNRCGRTPLSLCLKTDALVDLIGPLIRRGAQLHHLCGADLTERCNHLHYAMLKSSPRTINATLDEVSRQYPFGADGMYAMNRQRETPKASLQR